MPKIQDMQIRKTLADLCPEPPSLGSKPVVSESPGLKLIHLVKSGSVQQSIKRENICKSEITEQEDNTCTICGQSFTEKPAFNAHIKAHLKQKLMSRKMQQSNEIKTEHNITPPVKRKLDTSITDEPQPPSVKIKLETVDPDLSLADMETPSPDLSPEMTSLEDQSVLGQEKTELQLNTDLTMILDQIEKDFDSSSINLDSPPDSDSDSGIFSFLNSEDDSANKTPPPMMMMVPPRLAESSSISDDIENLLNQTTTSDHDYLLNSSAPLCTLSADPGPLTQTPGQESNISKVLIPSQKSSPTKTFAIVNHTTGKVFIQREGAPARTLTMLKPGARRSSEPETLKDTTLNLGLSINNAKIESTPGVDAEQEFKIVMSQESLKTKPIKSKQIADCSICGKSITTKNMARHMEKHTGKKKFQCEICQASFFQKTHLKNHIVLHENGECHECRDCNQKFIRKTDLQKHQKAVHSSDIPFLCNVCGVQFSDPVTLELHVSKCNTDKTELCGLCGDKFKDKEAMIQHMQTSHATTTIEKPYSCLVCQKSFVQKGHLNRHMKSHSDEELDLVCQRCSKHFSSQQSLDQHHCCGGTLLSSGSGAKLVGNHRSRSMSSGSPSSDFTSLLSPGSLSSHDFDFFEEESNCSTILSQSPGAGLLPTSHSRSVPHNYSESTRLDSLDDNFCSFLNDFDSNGPLINDSISADKSFSTSLEDSRPQLTFNDISDPSFFDISSQLDENIYDADLFSSIK